MTVSPQNATAPPAAQADDESLYQATMQAFDTPGAGLALRKWRSSSHR